MDFTYAGSCEKCGGTGTIKTVNPAALRECRRFAGLSLREVARRLGLSAPYISDVELGRRACTPKIEAFYRKLLKH